MKTAALLIVSSVFLTQAVEASTTKNVTVNFSLPEALLETGLESLRELAEGIFKVVIEGQKLLHKYSDQYQNYEAMVKNMTKTQVFNLFEAGSKAVKDAEATVAESNRSVATCFTKRREEIKEMVPAVTEGLTSCAITQISKFADEGIFLAQLGNTSVHALLQVRKDMRYCNTHHTYTIPRMACIGVATGKAGLEAAKVSAQVAVSTANALSLMWRARTQFSLCLELKVGPYKQLVAELPVNLAACTAKSIIG